MMVDTGRVLRSDSYLCQCNWCGELFIPTRIISCPVCGCCNVLSVPLNDDNRMTWVWLGSHGFSFIKERLEVECCVE